MAMKAKGLLRTGCLQRIYFRRDRVAGLVRMLECLKVGRWQGRVCAKGGNLASSTSFGVMASGEFGGYSFAGGYR
jgi:hypothetical protein